MDGIPPSICPTGFYRPLTRPPTLENAARRFYAERGSAIPAHNRLCTTLVGMAKRFFRRARSGFNASRDSDVGGIK